MINRKGKRWRDVFKESGNYRKITEFTQKRYSYRSGIQWKNNFLPEFM